MISRIRFPWNWYECKWLFILKREKIIDHKKWKSALIFISQLLGFFLVFGSTTNLIVSNIFEEWLFRAVKIHIKYRN